MENRLSRFLRRTNTELIPAPETTLEVTPQPTGPRIMVFGSRLSGSIFLKDGLTEYLTDNGIQDPDVETHKNVQSIKEGFFGGFLKPDGTRLDPSIPVGVILLPLMRQYMEHDGTGMDVPVYETAIPEQLQKLCDEHGVPLIRIYENYTLEESTAALAPLLLKASSPEIPTS